MHKLVPKQCAEFTPADVPCTCLISFVPIPLRSGPGSVSPAKMNRRGCLSTTTPATKTKERRATRIWPFSIFCPLPPRQTFRTSDGVVRVCDRRCVIDGIFDRRAILFDFLRFLRQLFYAWFTKDFEEEPLWHEHWLEPPEDKNHSPPINLHLDLHLIDG